MSSLLTNLLFLHSHIHDPELARRLAQLPRPAQRPAGKRWYASVVATLLPLSARLCHGIGDGSVRTQ
jgi:hypothetical protein